MATFSASNYNLVNASWNVNADNGWGGYKWPGGVPENLLANFAYQQVNGLQQTIRGRVRVELVELFQLAAAIADLKHGYQIYSFHDGKAWGPWTYENRAIAGTNSASNHSRGRAWDVNAPFNGYANGFSNISSDIPPALVNDWESIGLSWGGRYGDAMHFEYAFSPDDVAGHEERGRQILDGKVIGTPDKPEDDSMSAADVQALKDYIDAKLADLPTNIWIKGITGDGPGQHANELLAAAAVNAAIAATQVKAQTDEIDKKLAELPTAVWTKSITDKSSAQILVDLVTATQRLEAKAGTAPAPPAPVTYTVVSGDSFNAIAAKLGVTPDALGAANPQVKDRSALDVGQVLNVPKG